MLNTTIPPIQDADAVAERADDLRAAGLNGMRLALVTLAPPAPPGAALVEVVFFNPLHVADIRAAVAAAPATAGQVFRIVGGQRLPAGPATGQVRCTAVADGETRDAAGNLLSLQLTVEPIGDYSTYAIELTWDPARIDPFFSRLPFKFRPGCFTNDCSPAWTPGQPPAAAPVIDYLAKDYDSFRHVLMTAMAQRVPGWTPTSEADLDQVLIDLFAAAADELSDYQDRVVNEAYLASARTRVSVARHARLVDYHVHQGNQASTWLALRVTDTVAPFTFDEELRVWAGHPDAAADHIHFATRERDLPPAQRTPMDPLINTLRLHTWGASVPALRAGTTSADLVSALPGAGQAEAERLRDLVNSGRLPRLLIQETRNPQTGRETGRDPRKRQLLELRREAVVLRDPLSDTWVTRVTWRGEDALRHDYAFTVLCAGLRVDDVTLFHGNLVRVHQGRPVMAHFFEPGTDPLPLDSAGEAHRHFERWTLYGEPRGVRCALPFAPLAHVATEPGGEVAPRSTARVRVEVDGVSEPWDEVTSLVHSDDTPEEGDHFVVETDEAQRSVLRFGNGVNGRLLPEGAVVHCEYQEGQGASGNVGADAITWWAPPAGAAAESIVAVWNPFDVVDGRDPEPVAQVLRRAPEAYRARQLRAVTLADYVTRAEEVPGVARAVARYAWTGSWRTVRLVIDPAGGTTLDPALRDAVRAHLDSVRLIGEDLELRPPRFVPLVIEVAVCLDADSWVEDVRFVLEQEFSSGWTPDGRRGFFHPDVWTFGQALHRSQIAGRLHAVAGVAHVVSIAMTRRNDRGAALLDVEQLAVAFDEIILVQNDPDHLERGSIRFTFQGGRQ